MKSYDEAGKLQRALAVIFVVIIGPIFWLWNWLIIRRIK